MKLTDPIEALKEYIRHASVSTDPEAIDAMTGARVFVSELLESMGFDVEQVQTPKHPIVLAKRGGDPSWPHLLLYGHYDVQPADPLELWDSPAFEPTLKGNRMYGRGAADNKGPQLAMLLGLEKALLENPNLPVRLTVMIEGEEEIGSPSFPGFLKSHASLLGADLVVLSDTCSSSKEQIVVTTGLRGVIALEVTARGPMMDLHSGLHGGPVMNPIAAISQICASLHHEDGRVNVDGFYDDVVMPEDWEREELKKLPLDEVAYKEMLGVKEFHTPEGITPFESLRFYPTLEFNGIGGGYQGPGSKTVIPSVAFAKITCRLVANQSTKDVMGKVIQTIKERCPKGVELEFSYDHGGEPYLVMPPARSKSESSSVLAKAFDAIDSSVSHVFGKAPLFLREGGSIPIIGTLKLELGLDSLMTGLFLPEDNLHSPNESMDLELYQKGIDMYEQFFQEFGK